jgi:DNA-binding transcriptional LysR family regulator
MLERLDFSLTQVRYFVRSAEMGNISLAAQSLHASQSTVSMAIRQLELQLETQLFHRHRAKGVSLTASGRVLLDEAKSLLHQAYQLRARSREWNAAPNGVLDVACLPSIAPFVIPAVLSRLKTADHGLTLNVHEESGDRLLALLRNGSCELAVTGELPGENMTFTKLADVSLSALVAQSDPLAAVGRATLAELAARPMLLVDGPANHHALRSLFTQAGIPWPQTVSTSSVSTLLGLVGAGVGFALQHSRMACPAVLDGGGVSIDIEAEHPCVSQVGVTTVPGVPVSRRAKEFVNVLRQSVRDVYRVADDARRPVPSGRGST